MINKRMKFYEMKEVLKDSGYVQASHQWGLPGVNCDVCGQTWANSGLDYPSVDLSNFPEKARFVDRWPVALNVLQELKEVIFEPFPQVNHLKPGSSFGPLVGIATGRLKGFLWNMPWSLMITGEDLEKLKAYDLSLPDAFPPILKFRGKPQEVFEFEIPAHGRLLNPVYDPEYPAYCPACLRDGGSLPPHLIVEANSLPDDLDIFRLANFTTVIIVSERFVRAAEDLRIEGASFEEVELA